MQMNIARYEPRYRGLGLLSRLLDDDFDSLVTRGADNVADWTPAVDIREDEKAYVLTADLPGVKPEDIDVTMEKGILTIRGNRDEAKEDEDRGYKRYERVRGSFMRRFALPDTANGDDIEAKTEHGVLHVTIPKHAEPQPRRITVNQS